MRYKLKSAAFCYFVSVPDLPKQVYNFTDDNAVSDVVSRTTTSGFLVFEVKCHVIYSRSKKNHSVSD